MKYFFISMHLGKFRLAYKVFLPVITNLLRFVERSPGMVVVRHIGRNCKPRVDSMLHKSARLETCEDPRNDLSNFLCPNDKNGESLLFGCL